jgi:hypothetical protein
MIFEIISKTWKPTTGKSGKMVISWAPERFQKLEFDPNVRFYKYGHNSDQKWVPRHDSDGIRREISREKR